MKIMKKRFTLLTAMIVAAFILLSACNKTDSSKETDNQTDTTASTTVQPTTDTPSQTEASQPDTTAATTAQATEETTTQALPEGCLKDVFAEHGMKVGTCLTTQMTGSAGLTKLITGQFNSVTMENAMKPDSIFDKKESIATGELVVKFNNDMVKMLDWAKENNMAVRGHTFVWYSQTPDWIFHEDFDTKKDFASREVMLARMESMMKQMFEMLEDAGYLELFYAYDVVNEAWMEDGTMRKNNWTTTVGDDYMWYAFKYARQYAPEYVDLYYNDYNEQFKYNALVKFVETLVDDDGSSLIDGIGLQAHLYTKDDLDLYFKAVDALAATGLKIELTELDVSLGAWQNTLKATDENLKTQGRFYYNLINGLFERVDAGTINMDALTFWGYSDGKSWRSEASPLLYNKYNEPKYAYYGALQLKEYAGFEDE